MNQNRKLHEIGGDRRFELLVNAVRDYAIYLLDSEGHVASWNAGAERFKGYSADEIIGQHFSRFYTEEDRQAGEPQRALAQALATGKYEIEAWRQRKDGTRFRAGVLIDPVFDADGEHIGFAKVTRDLTERWQSQQEVERAREAMAQAQKMEAVGRLTGGVAHDFNNLLTVIRSSADLLKLPNLSEEKRRRYLDAISDTADRAAALTAQLLAFARRQPLKPEVFDVGERVQAMRPMIETSVGSTIRVTINGSETSLIHADLNQFETALLNLIINARDAMPAGGALSVATRLLDALPKVRGHGGATGRFVAVRVEDNGSGIAPEALNHIFEPFFTTKALNKGTGLGLSQAHGFAKQSGGEIAVESRVGVGTTFTIYLPVARAGQVAGEPGAADGAAGAAQDAARAAGRGQRSGRPVRPRAAGGAGPGRHLGAERRCGAGAAGNVGGEVRPGVHRCGHAGDQRAGAGPCHRRALAGAGGGADQRLQSRPGRGGEPWLQSPQQALFDGRADRRAASRRRQSGHATGLGDRPRQ